MKNGVRVVHKKIPLACAIQPKMAVANCLLRVDIVLCHIYYYF